MGLFPKYERLTLRGRGAAFFAHTDEDRLVGLSTAKVDDSGLVDGFVHRSCVEAWESLIRAALDWGTGAGASGFSADVANDDEDKRRGFERLGFETAGRRQAFAVENPAHQCRPHDTQVRGSVHRGMEGFRTNQFRASRQVHEAARGLDELTRSSRSARFEGDLRSFLGVEDTDLPGPYLDLERALRLRCHLASLDQVVQPRAFPART
jgi:hypothetical protein